MLLNQNLLPNKTIGMRKIYSAIFQRLTIILVVSLTITLFSQNTFGQILAWDFNLKTGAEVTVNSTTTNANLGTSTISRGAGLNIPPFGGNRYSNTFDAVNYRNTASSLATAIADNAYFQFAISGNVGFVVFLSTLDAVFLRSTANAPNSFQWQYSLNAFATAGVNIGSTITYNASDAGTGATNGTAQTQINLSGIAALQNVPAGTSITIRIYGWGAGNTASTFALGRLAGNDLAIGGTVVAAIPTITNTTLTAFGAQCINSTYGPNAFTITGANLTNANVTVGALAGFTYSTTAGGAYTTSLSLTQPGGAYSQQLFVKFTPIAVQSYSGNIPVGGGGASSVNVAASGSGVNSSPIATAGAASGITLTTATVPGTITSAGCSAVTAYGIENSTTPGFANGSGIQVASTNLVGSNFSSALTGLTQSTVYYYHSLLQMPEGLLTVRKALLQPLHQY